MAPLSGRSEVVDHLLQRGAAAFVNTADEEVRLGARADLLMVDSPTTSRAGRP